MLKYLSRLLVRWRYRLFQRHRHQQLCVEEVEGRPLVVLPEVFNPKLFRTGAFMAEVLDQIQIAESCRVLDMGTGTGAGAVVAARRAGHVDAVDINAQAVRCARINALLNQVDDRVTVHQGDLFEPVSGSRFDLIIFNPPFFRGAPKGDLDHAWRSEDTVERFAAALPEHLTAAGFALVVLSTDGETPAFLDAFRRAGLSADIEASRDFVNETLTVFRCASSS